MPPHDNVKVLIGRLRISAFNCNQAVTCAATRRDEPGHFHTTAFAGLEVDAQLKS